jgi:hypothetical protein
LRPTADGRVRISYEDERPDDRIDEVLWQREFDSPGLGEPIWADVHSHRQRSCQIEGRCQVCGEVMAAPWLWLIPPYLAQRGDHGSVITDVAPTCQDCIDTAMTVCPALRRVPPRLLEVRDYRPVAVFGDLIHPGRNGRLVHTQGEARFDSPAIQHVMARQMIVELWNFRRRQM